MGDYHGWANRPTWALYTGITNGETEVKRVKGWFSSAANQRLSYDDAVDLAAERLEDRVYDLYDAALYKASPMIRDMLIHSPNETDVDYRRIVSMIVGKGDYNKLLPASARQSNQCVKRRQKPAQKPAQASQARKSGTKQSRTSANRRR